MSRAHGTVPLIPVDLEQLLVPWRNCLGVALGPVSTDLVNEMEARDFDQAPVFRSAAPRAAVLGLVSRDRLRELGERGEALRDDDTAIRRTDDTEIWLFAGLLGLLGWMSEDSAAIVYFEDTVEEYGSMRATFGLITRADLNKHAVRLAAYDILAKLEVALAEIIGRSLTDYLQWIRGLSGKSQARVRRYWKLSKLGEVDVGPVAGATLADLLKTVADHKGLRTQLGYESRSAFEEATARIPDVRNQVMHPVRPLITDADSCRRLEGVLEEAWRLTWRMEQGQERPQPR